MDRGEQRCILEALLLAASEPVPAARLAAIVPGCSPAGARDLVAELNAEYAAQSRAFVVEEVAGGFQLRTRPELAPWIQELRPERPLRLSRAALETLAIVAYRQPLTRAEIEHVRGVEAGPVLRSLIERRLIRIAGHREVPGRPLLYATTRRFLEVFGLGSLEDLPTLRQLEELLSEAAEGEAAETEGVEAASEILPAPERSNGQGLPAAAADDPGSSEPH